MAQYQVHPQQAQQLQYGPAPVPQQIDMNPYNGQRDNLVFSLDIVQQPERARMCGFGDKDRRPITPPPCVRLVIRDLDTNKEVDYTKTPYMHFVLHVDLWRADGTSAANLVKHASNSNTSSISMATTTAFPPTPEVQQVGWVMGPGGQPVQAPLSFGGGMQYPYGQPTQEYRLAQPNPGSYTRNLIGSVAVSATLLNDPKGVCGLWFVLQDLSVRQEGHFRLKMSFMDVSELGAMLAKKTAVPEDGEKKQNLANKLCSTSTPILATCFSDNFQVHSAKRFPGVKESTELSKCFAGQGVKIPIRKEGKNAKDEDDDD